MLDLLDELELRVEIVEHACLFGGGGRGREAGEAEEVVELFDGDFV